MESEIELLERSKRMKAVASQLLQEKKILETLSLVGKPCLIGSFELDLMLEQDIDIVVETKQPKASAVKAMNIFITNEIAQKYELGDFVKYPRKKRPNGYILNLISNFKGKKWEVEIWFFKEIDQYLNQLHLYKSKINSKTRLEILKRKAEREYSGKSKHEWSSIQIYDEVLGITTS